MMKSKLKELKSILAEISDLHAAAALLGWDQQTYMPSGGVTGRGFQLGTVESVAHREFTSAKVGSLLDQLAPMVEQLDPDSDDARLIQVTRRNYEKSIKVPLPFVAEFAQATTHAHQSWVEARQDDNFAKFRPYAEKIIDFRRRYADFFSPYEHVYDPLLDDFEPGLKTSEVAQIFQQLRSEQTILVKQIAEQPEINSSFLYLDYDAQRQWDFCVQIISQFGFDWQHGRMDHSAHPFTEGIGNQDVRITTRVNPNYLNTALFGSLHEAGHALYEMGIDSSLARSPLGSGVSLAVHESQSRLWENLIGRSRPFWDYFYPHLQNKFPDQLRNINPHAFYRAINHVQPSAIRIEADEATYNLHIILRFELETALMEGSLAAKDLPEAWNSGMKDILGIVPQDDSRGVLQDIHWSSGLFGYFPTYALGNLISAQLWECIQRDIPDLTDQIQMGEFSALLTWLRQNIHRHGAKFEPQELVERVTGSRIEPTAYLRYLRTKFGEIYSV